MARETKAQRNTRVSMLLGDYDARSRELRKLSKEVDTLKQEIRDGVEPGTYGDWTLSEGTEREILDQPKARELLKQHGIPVPTTMTSAPVVVRPVAGK